eukprot:14243015-Alexandrium_andersonii.AAC.1
MTKGGSLQPTRPQGNSQRALSQGRECLGLAAWGTTSWRPPAAPSEWELYKHMFSLVKAYFSR